MSVVPAFGMVMVVVMGVIVPIIVLLVMGLSNRHTRGATKGVAIALGVLIGLVMLWRMAAVPSFNHTANLGQQQAFFEDQIATFDRMAEDLERSVDSDANRQLADQYRRQAHEFRTHLSHMPAGTPQANFPNAPSWVAVSPVVLLVFMVIVFLVFKHAGPTMGFAALGVPFLLLFVGYSSLHEVEVQTADEIRMQSLAQLEGHASDIIVQASAEEEHDAAAAHGEIPMDSEQSEPSEDLENRGDESLDAPAVAEEVPPPDWVTHPPKSVPNVYRRLVSSSWYPSEEECRTKIDPKIEQAVSNYLHQTVGDHGMGLVHSLPQLGITRDFIYDNLVSNEFCQTQDFEHTEKPLSNLHYLLEIDSADSDFMTAQWRAHARMHRIAWVRNLMVGVMLSLAGVLGLIKIDTATKGYYTKRLFIGVPAAIIGGVMLIVATAEWWDKFF